MEPNDLVLCPLTIRADLHACTPDQYRSVLDLAVEHGYRGVDLGMLDVGIARAAGIPRDAFLAWFAERGLSTPIVDVLSGWAQGESEREIAARALPVLEVAERAGAKTVVAICMEATLPSIEETARGFAQVCALAAERGLAVSIEFFPWGGIGDIATAWEVVRASGADNGGIVLDTWHWARSRNPAADDLATLRAIPGGRIHVVQVDDAAPVPGCDLLRETLRARRLPGHGMPGTVDVLRTLREIGARPIVAPEVFSRDLFRQGAGEMMRQVAAATRAVLARAGWT